MHRGFEVAKVASTQSNARHSRRVGAALFSGRVLLSIGANRYGKTHPKAVGCAWNIHAEHQALLRRQHFDAKQGLTMYVYRETANGVPANSTPCQNCLCLLKEADVKTVRFLDENGKPKETKL